MGNVGFKMTLRRKENIFKSIFLVKWLEYGKQLYFKFSLFWPYIYDFIYFINVYFTKTPLQGVFNNFRLFHIYDLQSENSKSDLDENCWSYLGTYIK